MTSYPDLMDDDLPDPEAMLADKGYDSDTIRSDLERCGIDPVIPTNANRKIHCVICKKTYAVRNRIERFFSKLKHSQRCATRYDKLGSIFFGLFQLATIRWWIRFVHTT